MMTSRFVLPALLLWAWAALPVAGDERRVWVVTETRHVLRGEPPGNLREAKLSIARNEWGSFQILVRGDAPIEGLRVEAGDLRGPSRRRPGTVRVRLYREHQFSLDTGTYRNTDFTTGRAAGQLLPHPARQGAGASRVR